MTDIDLFADDNKPEILWPCRSITVRVPPKPRMKGEKAARTNYQVTLLIDEHNYIEITNWIWGSVRFLEGTALEVSHDIRKEIWDWLEEWELVVLRPIGPEDSEYFATDKLIEGGVEL